MNEPDWLVDRVPDEDAMPPSLPAPVRAEPVVDSEMWVDGAWGWYAGVHMVDLAMRRGYWIAPHDLALLTWARAGGNSDAYGLGSMPHGAEHWSELQGEVLQWLNDHVAPEGHAFAWSDGDLMLATDETWCAWSGEPCTDAGHTSHFGRA